MKFNISITVPPQVHYWTYVLLQWSGTHPQQSRSPDPSPTTTAASSSLELAVTHQGRLETVLVPLRLPIRTLSVCTAMFHRPFALEEWNSNIDGGILIYLVLYLGKMVFWLSPLDRTARQHFFSMMKKGFGVSYSWHVCLQRCFFRWWLGGPPDSHVWIQKEKGERQCTVIGGMFRQEPWGGPYDYKAVGRLGEVELLWDMKTWMSRDTLVKWVYNMALAGRNAHAP